MDISDTFANAFKQKTRELLFHHSRKCQHRMADLHVKDQPQQRLADLGLQYPLWLFNIDDPRWPRRLASLTSESYPAKIAGWTASTSEYEMFLDRLQDLSRAQGETRRYTAACTMLNLHETPFNSYVTMTDFASRLCKPLFWIGRIMSRLSSIHVSSTPKSRAG